MLASARPRLGVLDFGPIQYHTPLYQRLASRGKVELSVLFLSDQGLRPMRDKFFGVEISWDTDLLSGYSHHFLTGEGSHASLGERLLKLTRWLRSRDVVVLYGYSSPWMLSAMLICRSYRIPYLMRGDSKPDGDATDSRRHLRNMTARITVSSSAGGLAVGQLNEDFYRRFGARRITFAPYSVEDERFARPPRLSRSEILARWGLPDNRPVVVFSGKFAPHKRPLDLAAAIRLLPNEVTVLFIGDGALASRIRAALDPDTGVVTGFVNQSEIPAYYHASDVMVLPSELENWGLVINEAMNAGVLPVVSDRVGAGPDLVQGVGEIYRCGDVADLAAALDRALVATRDPGTRRRVRQHVARYCLDRTAAGFEEAAISVTAHRR
jgi:glycosyltransferase involved in cell wall biosynthesis